MTGRLLIAFASAFGISALVGSVLIPYLRKIKAGQMIREDGPVWHSAKAGTPTMGGLMFIAGVTLVSLAANFRAILGGDLSTVYILCFGLLFASVGFYDDSKKLRNHRNKGLGGWQKLALQLAVSALFLVVMHLSGHTNPVLRIPFTGFTLELNPILYYLLCMFIITGCVNAVNITDGVDGLAAGVSIPIEISYIFVALLLHKSGIGLISAALLGAVGGFLVYNFHPAKCFMGDTGSLFLGWMICALALALDYPLLLVPMCLVYILETLSDIIQVLYFKATHGKRIFKMAPIHHHFEMCGWSEIKIFSVFTTVSCVCALLAWWGAKLSV